MNYYPTKTYILLIKKIWTLNPSEFIFMSVPLCNANKQASPKKKRKGS